MRLAINRAPAPRAAAFSISHRSRSAPCPRRPLVARASSSGSGAQSEVVKYEHILLAILDSNPLLSSASRSALQTAAGLATQNASKLTVMFVDEAGQKVGSQRLQMVQGELQSRGLEDVRYVEEEVEAAAVGKGSVAVGEVADSVEADLVVLSTAAVHEKHVDANLLAEFVGCPIMMLP